MPAEHINPGFDPTIRSVERLGAADRPLDVAMLEAAAPDLDARFRKITHYDYYGNPGIVLDLGSAVCLNETISDGNENITQSKATAVSPNAYRFWELGDFFTDEIMVAALDPRVPKLTQEEALNEAGVNLADYLEGVAIADITEAGIVTYPADINYIFNPRNIVTPERYMQIHQVKLSPEVIKEMYANTPPNVLFPPTWWTQEFGHTDVGQTILRGAGYNMRAHKVRKIAWQSTASTPNPQDTPEGTIYTDFQEGSTANHYGKSSRIAGRLATAAERVGKPESAAFWHASAEAQTAVGSEEAGHRTYIRATRRSGVRNADAELRSHIYARWAEVATSTDKKGKPMIYMPGLFIPDFVQGSVRAERAGMYGRLGALQSMQNTLDASYLDRPGDLTPQGEEAVQILRDHAVSIEKEIARIEEKAARRKAI